MSAGSVDAAAASIETAAAALVSVLDTAGCEDAARVSPTQLRTLRLVADNPGLNVNGLAERLGVNPSSASRLCDRLEALGLLDRQAADRDRREVKISLTAQSRTLLDKLAEHRRRALTAVLASMTEPARRDLERSLAAFAQAHARQQAYGSVAADPEAVQRIA
jgi:DNA-binding MarR family transcriptional regulator